MTFARGRVKGSLILLADILKCMIYAGALRCVGVKGLF